MYRLSRCAFAGSSIAVCLASFLVALELSAAATPSGWRAEPQQVNRTLKGDRLPLKAADGAAIHPKLPDGCIATNEGADKKHIYTAEIAGRCVV